MAKKRPRKSESQSESLNGLSDSDFASAPELPALECRKRVYEEELGVWEYFVDWRGEDLEGQSVLINGVKRRVKSCRFEDDFTVLSVREEKSDAG
jgi:hypothetical protein